MDNSETSYAEVRLFGRKKDEKNFKKLQQFVNRTVNEFAYLLGVTNSVCDEVFANQSNCNV